MWFNPKKFIAYGKWIFRLFFVAGILFCNALLPVGAATENPPGEVMNGKPVVLIIADKLDAEGFFNTQLPGIRRYLETSTVGLMNVRSGVGYVSSSGILTLGSGNRSIFPPDLSVNQRKNQRTTSNDPRSYWEWSLGLLHTSAGGIVVPEIGWILSQSAEDGNSGYTGLLGTVAHQHGWRTYLVGNGSNQATSNQPSALLLMDRKGLIDGGDIGSEIERFDPKFPYGYRFDRQRVMTDLRHWIAPKRLIAVNFGDFARLDTYREEMLPQQFERVEQSVWRDFDAFLTELLTEWSSDQVTLIVLSPSISKDGTTNKDLLAPVVIRNSVYREGVLGSATTNWPGLVSNLDLLPTILAISGTTTDNYLTGRVIKPYPERNPLARVEDLRQKIRFASLNQRSLLDWFQGLITGCWIAAVFCFGLKYKSFGNWLLSVIALIPLVLLLMPGLTVIHGQTGVSIIAIFLMLSIGMAVILALIRDVELRFLAISAASWLGILVDQISGWSLIRFSALGYSAAAGSRYYGIGNEYMGIFLGVTLVLAELIRRRTGKRWPVPILLGISLLAVGWPQLGINFGGLLGAIPGFTLYLFMIYHWRLNNRKTWLAAGLGIGAVLLVGWWDSTRSIDLQTHIGRFFQLLFSRDLGPIWEIILRKLEMNLKLMANSPWARIIGLTVLIAVSYRLILRRNLIAGPQRMVWYAILGTGIGILLVNDSGVVAMGTCFAYSFSFIMIENGKSCEMIEENKGQGISYS